MSLASSKSERPVSLLWGCELRGAGASYTFQAPDGWPYEQQLALRTVCLGEEAPDEFHVLEVAVTEDDDDGAPRAPVPLATLKPSVLPTATLLGVELTPPVTFRLRAGSGPLYVSGQHVSLMPAASWQEEEEEEEESAEESPALQDAGRGRVPGERRPERDEEERSDGGDGRDALPAEGRGRRQ